MSQPIHGDDCRPPAAPSYTCPRCGAVSHNLTDVAEGYCGRCHDWTRPPTTDK